MVRKENVCKVSEFIVSPCSSHYCLSVVIYVVLVLLMLLCGTYLQ